ncbi:hypothetical protein HDV05_000122 [Chytridiales sp. JEL 0842]|nr:hypothetical protein HDV05_000122 [Chytridiales sp. JEL 0842]
MLRRPVRLRGGVIVPKPWLLTFLLYALLTWVQYRTFKYYFKYQQHETVELVFYYHKDITQEPKLVGQMRNLLKKEPQVMQCFSRVRFMNALLTDEEDPYPDGASQMFFKLFSLLSPHFKKPSTSANTADHQTYQAIYYLEPDNIPCRPYWMDRLYEEASIPGDFWMRGSILRNRNPVVGEWTLANHINGNALYRLDDQKFAQYIEKVKQEFLVDSKRYLGSYDIALDLIRRNRSMIDWLEFADTAAYWQFTNTVQNWYRTPVNATELCMGDAETYLVHGREVFL